GIDPVKVLDHQDQGLRQAQADEQTLDPVEHPLPALGRVEFAPRPVTDGNVQDRHQGRERTAERLVELGDFADDLRMNVTRVIAILDLEESSQKLEQGKISVQVPGREGAGCEDLATTRVGRVDELVK